MPAGGGGHRGASRASVGVMLRSARESLGENIHDVARNLRIRRIYISAIEESEYDKLPGTAYAIGFVRSYSEYLGLDSDELVRRFKTENLMEPVAPAPANDLAFPSSSTMERHLPNLGYVVVAVLLAVVAYGGWYAYNQQFWGLMDLVSSPPEEGGVGSPTADNGGIFSPALDDRPPLGGNLPEAPTATTPAPEPLAPPELPTDDGTGIEQPDPLPSVTNLVENLGGNQQPEPTRTSNGSLAAPPGRIILRARADVWFTVRDAAADRLEVAKLLTRGETYLVPNKPNLVLLIGNAGLMDVAVGDQQIPPLGEMDEVVRDVKLDPDRLLGGTATQ